MAEKEPKVTPIIRLPQIRAARGGASGKASDSSPQPEPKGAGATFGVGAAEDEELLEDEAELQMPLRSQISGEQTKLAGETSGLRAGVSSLLRRALLNFAEQERQRAWLVTVLLAAQAAVLLVVLPGYWLGPFQLAGVLVGVGGLVLYGIIWLLNWMRRSAEASYLLVVGGGTLVVLDLLLSAAHLVSLETLHISLLFLLVILSGGLLFSPETAFILSVIFGVFTVVVLLLFPPAGSLAAVFSAQGRYLSLVYLVAVQLGVGVVAWLFGRQMQESVHLITYVSGLQMSNKRLHKRLRETAEQKRHLEAGIAIIQQTHARVAAGDYSARAHVEGDLLPLAVSLNLMLERVESFVHSEHERERMETAVAGLAELAGRVGQDSLGRLPVPTGTALDGLSIAIKQMQMNVNQRLARVQQSTAALMATIGRCQDGLLPVAEVLEEHLRTVDALVIAADNIMNSAQRQIDFATQAEQLLLAAAPAGVDLKPVEEQANQRKGTSALRLAEEMERRVMLASKVDVAVAPQAAEAAQHEAQPEPRAASVPEVSPESEADTVQEPVPSSEDQSGEEQKGREQKNDEQIPQPAEGAIEPAVDTEETQAPEAPVPIEEVAAEAPAAAETIAGDEKLALDDVDRQAAEEAQGQESDWNLSQLRELVRVLSSMASEATQQERNARTLTFKLRAMLQGMPNTRRVDMMAAWLRAALEAVAQAAAQVQQASKTLPASTFQAARRERAGSTVDD